MTQPIWDPLAIVCFILVVLTVLLAMWLLTMTARSSAQAVWDSQSSDSRFYAYSSEISKLWRSKLRNGFFLLESRRPKRRNHDQHSTNMQVLRSFSQSLRENSPHSGRKAHRSIAESFLLPPDTREACRTGPDELVSGSALPTFPFEEPDRQYQPWFNESEKDITDDHGASNSELISERPTMDSRSGSFDDVLDHWKGTHTGDDDRPRRLTLHEAQTRELWFA